MNPLCEKDHFEACFNLKLQPQLDIPSMLDEWKLLQADQAVFELDTNQQIDHYWNGVFLLKSLMVAASINLCH